MKNEEPITDAPCASLRPRQDSNLRTRLRRPVLYPLSYEGIGTATQRWPVECTKGGPRSIKGVSTTKGSPDVATSPRVLSALTIARSEERRI